MIVRATVVITVFSKNFIYIRLRFFKNRFRTQEAIRPITFEYAKYWKNNLKNRNDRSMNLEF